MIDLHEESLMDHDEETGRLFLHLKAAQATTLAALTDALSDLGITVPQLLILRAISMTPAITSAELARQCFVTPQAMVANVSKLESSGLIARSKGEGRTIETHLTDKGRAILDRAGSRVESARRYVAQQIGEEHVRSLEEGLLALTECMRKSLIVTTARTWDLDETGS
ncbi:MAG TPA: MarR family transcriptional regulator [Candidatus Acidoferrales bacterium]|nr:MarR family transcriptional regulator [Candidatus Acidoferrales bacterium]